MKKGKERELRIAALFDGRPGHEKQTKGIIQALQEKIKVQVVALPVTRMGLSETIVNSCRVFMPGSGMTHPDVADCDLLIGTGSQTHLPLVLYNKQYHIPIVTCMSPASFLRHCFDICFVPMHDGLKQSGNIILTAGAPNCAINAGKHRPEYGLILLGGIDAKSHFWQDDEIIDKVRNVIIDEPCIHWTISSSPRTPEKTVLKVRNLVKLYGNCSFFHYEETGDGWIEAQYTKSTIVWVTSDSISMVYEALTAGCKVGLFPMQWKKSRNKFKTNEAILVDKNMALLYDSWKNADARWGEMLNINEAQRCAEYILEIL
jgi:mitochondrial fission protein ELM1